MPLIKKGTEHFIMTANCGKVFYKKSPREINHVFKLHMKTCHECKSVNFEIQNVDRRTIVPTNGNTDWMNFCT